MKFFIYLSFIKNDDVIFLFFFKLSMLMEVLFFVICCGCSDVNTDAPIETTSVFYGD